MSQVGGEEEHLVKQEGDIENTGVDNDADPVLDEEDEEEKRQKEAKLFQMKMRQKQRQKFEINTYYLIESLLTVFVIIFFVYPYQILYCTIGLIYDIFVRQYFNQVLLLLWIIIYCSSTIFMVVQTIIYYGTDEYQRFWYYDSIIFFISTMLVISYVKSVQDNKLISHFVMIFRLIQYKGFPFANTLFILSLDDQFYSFDIAPPQQVDINQDFSSYMMQEGLEQISVHYNYFIIDYKDFKLKHRADEWLKDCYAQKFNMRIGQIIGLLIIILSKSMFSAYYIVYHNIKFNTEIAISVIATTLFYLFCTIILLRTLGSYDLRRKTQMMNDLNDKLDFRTKCNIDDLEEANLLDITCPNSIECWDNARNFVTNYYNNITSYLELAYLGLFLYFIFVFLIIISAYGEFYWVFDEKSVYLEPLMVIQYSFDFIFLVTFFFIRVWEGQQFNDTFGDLDDNLDFLIDVVDDLIQMYDFHFIPKMQPLYLNDEEGTLIDSHQKSIYGIIVQHIQHKAERFIKREASYLGKVYENGEEDKIQRAILQNMKRSLKKVKRQLDLDEKQNKYQFLGLFEVEFGETFYTIVLMLLSFLPNIIPKVVAMFKDS